MNVTKYEVPHCGAFSTPHSHPSWAQIFASGSCFQISLAWIPPLMFHNRIVQLAIKESDTNRIKYIIEYIISIILLYNLASATDT